MAWEEQTKLIGRAPTGVTGLWRIVLDGPDEIFWAGALRWSVGGAGRILAPRFKGVSATSDAGYGSILRPTEQWSTPATRVATIPTRVESFPDTLFYVREGTSGQPVMPLSPDNVIVSSDAVYSYIPLRYNSDEAARRSSEGDIGLPKDSPLDWVNKAIDRMVTVGKSNFYGIISNSRGMMIKVQRGYIASSDEIVPVFGWFAPNNAGIVTNEATKPYEWDAIKADSSSAATLAIMNVRDIVLWNGSVCYAGYSSWNPSEGTSGAQEEKPHYMCFSSPAGSKFAQYEIGADTEIAIGQHPGEPIIRVAVNSIATDTRGSKGQLVVFTPRKVAIYDGLPPIPGDDQPNQLAESGAPSPIGCWGRETVQKTHAGLVYLAADGVVRLIPPSGFPVDIGRAIEPKLSRLNPANQMESAAFYWKGYYVITVPGRGSGQRDTWIADLRYVNPRAKDYGVKWTGPHTNWPPCRIYTVAYGEKDQQQVMGGSANGSQLFEVMREDIPSDAAHRQSNFDPDNVSVDSAYQVQMKVRALSNYFDAGDAHAPKLLRHIGCALKTNDEVQVEVTGIAAGVDISNGQRRVASFTHTEEVVPSYGKLGEAELFLSPEGASELVTAYPGQRMRGRMFSIELRKKAGSSASADTQITISDISLALRSIGESGR